MGVNEHAEVSSIAAAAARPLGSATIATTLSFRAVNNATAPVLQACKYALKNCEK